ncbi:lipopolysaccharide biosynthesis protein [Microbacterium trichothecenolyticum]|uniref:lipopolysaccharide biosynthesis protein n=1 Tax=Microbacterium trichothecenolyticum TaxID=69370 RepID=UPI001C6E1E1C|nr:lipopolysaccharide biosynthesis protein [Microbacterium trichothecenolyticum]MBW9122385.1 lipopolysaccharide biosynthesis protein [Microbacterium trichothecenolyticum]
MNVDANLAHRASRGIVVTMGGMWGKTLIQLAAIMLLGRLLSPEDFGLVAMVTAISGIIDLVRDFGLTGAIIQAREISERAWRSLFWLALGLGVLLGGILAACAPLIADLYDEPQLVLITLVIAPSLIVNGLTMPLQARATRELKFALLARIDVVSMVGGVAAAITGGLLGWGYWSLILLVGTGLVVRLVMLWVALRPRPGWPRIHRDVVPLVSRGGSIFGAELLNYVERNADTVIIGQQLGPSVLGQYSRAYALFLMPLQQLNGPIGRVALPVLSKLQDDGDRYRRYIRGALLVIGYLTLPTYAILATVSEPLFAILLGPGWEQAAVLFSILAIAGIAQGIGKVRGWLFITMGRSHQQLLYDLVARPLVVVGFFVGIWWGGIYGLALTYGILSALLLIPGFAFAIRGTFVRGSDIVFPVLRPLMFALLAFGAAFAATRAVDLVPILEILVGGVAGAIVMGPLLLIPAYRRDVAQIMGFVKQMRKPKARAEEPEAGAEDAAAPAAAEAYEAVLLEDAATPGDVLDAEIEKRQLEQNR